MSYSIRPSGSELVTGAILAVLAGCNGLSNSFAPSAGLPDAWHDGAATRAEASTYRVVRLPTLGGLEDFSNWINDRGWVAGAADLPSGRSEHGFLWRNKKIYDLGTLGGKNSLAWPVNDYGEVAGDSDTATIDPLREDFCHFNIDGKNEFTRYTCSGYTLEKGMMTALPTLGGNNSSVFGMNDRGQVVGAAETSTRDSSCAAPQKLDFEAVVWEPHDNKVHSLPPFGSDPIGIAAAINQRGEVVGGSGVCAPLSPAIGVHALLWRNGKAIDLGNLGGTMFNAAFDINDRTHIVGFSDTASDSATHAFFWKDGKMTDLGTLPGDVYSFAFSINNNDQVVGESCDASFNCRAFIWENSVMTDLNSLVSTPLYLTLAESINNRGEITGNAYDQSSGGIPAFIAVPTGRHGGHAAARRILPPSIRAVILERSPLGRSR